MDLRFACALFFAGATGLGLDAPIARGQEPAKGEAAPKEARPRAELLPEWDAYYANVGLYIRISDDPFPDGGRLSETDVYRHLFERSYRPNVVALEASVYPMPVFGVWLRRHHPGFYDSTTLAGDLNIVQAVTAGFQEPWAVSAFFGSQMKFTRPEETERGANRAHVGYLVSGGTKHIKSNVLIDDDWFELEAKMKGERIFNEDRLSWSFRAGGRFNRNHDIANTVYWASRRSNLDFKSPFLSFLDNSRIDLFSEFSTDRPLLLRQEIIFGKKYPMEQRRMAWELDFGVIYERASKYTGALAPLAKTSLTLVFRPNIVF
jgi:hypothetical protein